MAGRHPAAWVPYIYRGDNGHAWTLAAEWVIGQHASRSSGTPPVIVADPARVPTRPAHRSSFERLLSDLGSSSLDVVTRQLGDAPVLAWEPDEATLALLAEDASSNGRPLCIVQGFAQAQVKYWADQADAINLTQREHPHVTAALEQLLNGQRGEDARAILLELQAAGLLNAEQLRAKFRAGLSPLEARRLEILMVDLPDP